MKEAESEVRITKETENKGTNTGREGGGTRYLPSTVHEGLTCDAVFYQRPDGNPTRAHEVAGD